MSAVTSADRENRHLEQALYCCHFNFNHFKSIYQKQLNSVSGEYRKLKKKTEGSVSAQWPNVWRVNDISNDIRDQIRSDRAVTFFKPAR